MMNLKLWLGLSVISTFIGCGLPQFDVDDLREGCAGLTLDTIRKQNGISAECKRAAQDLLPDASDNITGRIYSLGVERGATNLSIYVAGVKSANHPLSVSDFAGSTISVVRSGREQVLSASDYAVSSISAWGPGSVSVSLTTDYSASMDESDIKTASELFSDLVNTLPTGIEGEVSIFSEAVTLKQSFTSARNALLSGLAVDSSYERAGTALFDAVGTSFVALGARPTPVKIQMTLTDGLENASQFYEDETELGRMATDSNLFVVMVGTLFADRTVLEEISGKRGVFVYAKTIQAAKTALTDLIQGVGGAVKIDLAPEFSDATSVRVKVGAISTVFSP